MSTITDEEVEVVARRLTLSQVKSDKYWEERAPLARELLEAAESVRLASRLLRTESGSHYIDYLPPNANAIQRYKVEFIPLPSPLKATP